jgi:hypothetical protein
MIDIFLPIASDGSMSISWWDQDADHIGGIFYVVEFIGALVLCCLCQFDILKDSNFALLFCGEFLADQMRFLYYIIKGSLTTITYGYWFGLIAIVALVVLIIVSNFVKDSMNGNNNRPNQYGNNNNNNYMPPYNNNMYNNQQYNNPGPGYNNYR